MEKIIKIMKKIHLLENLKIVKMLLISRKRKNFWLNLKANLSNKQKGILIAEIVIDSLT
jgi:hypothetical protein